MNKFLFLGIMLVLFACNPKPLAKISGSIDHQADDFITIYNQVQDNSDTLKIIDGAYEGTINVTQPGIFYLTNGKYGFRLYLKPGADLTLNFDIEHLKNGEFNHIQISGKGSEESKLIYKLRAYDILINLRQALALPSDSFEVLIDNHYNQITQSIDSFKKQELSDDHFYERIDLIKKIEKSEKYMYYTKYHKRMAPNDTLPVPEEFYTKGNDIPLNNESFYQELRTYKYYVLQRYDTKIYDELRATNLKAQSVEYANKQMDLIMALDASQQVKDELGNRYVSSYQYATDEVKKLIETRYTDLIKKEKYIQEFKDFLSKLEGLKPGNKAPAFVYSDINGNEISSDDLKGKVIYIDVWATWCGPCKSEIPYLKTLEEELHGLDIAFVSISVDGDKEAWKKMVTEKDLKGYQLHANKEWQSDIIKNYAIVGIPRFILIDKNGNLVNANAKRPSDKDIKQELVDLAHS